MTLLSRGGVVLTMSLLPLTLQAQVPARWSECRADSLAGWNCGRYYSGTVTFKSELRVGSGQPITRTVTATIAAGRVTCRVDGTESGRFEAPGMLAVVPAGTAPGGEYDVVLWCPEAEGEPTSRASHATVEIRARRAASYGTLEGSDSWEHPEADTVNGVAGTESVTWRLQRP